MSEEAVEQSLSDHNRAFLAGLGESTRHAVVMTAHNGEIHSWNRGAETIYQLSAADAVARRLADLTPDDLLTTRLHAATIATMNGEPWSGQLQFVRGDGRPVWVSVVASPMHRRSGQVIGTIWLSWDITDRKQPGRPDDAYETAELRHLEPAAC